MDEIKKESFSMKKTLSLYLSRQFLALFFFSLLAGIVLFVIVDLVENIDRFIDAKTPWPIVGLYYLYYLPYIVVLTLPVGTLLATIFSIGNLARHNEIVAMKALGYSFYQVLGTLILLGVAISMTGFIFAEGLGIPGYRKKELIKRQYLDRIRKARFTYENLLIQEPPDHIISIDFFDPPTQTAYGVRIERFEKNKLIFRIDSEQMIWQENQWEIPQGYIREFHEDKEKAVPFHSPKRFQFQFTPQDLLKAHWKPDEMGIFELWHFIQKVKKTRGEPERWLTALHMRIAFPFSNLMIVLLGLPLVYNRRKKSLAVGFGIGLGICFIFYGLIKLGQTLGENKQMAPFLAAWWGNGMALLGSFLAIRKVRK